METEDQSQVQNMEEEQKVQQQPEKSKFLGSLEILALVKKSQSQNGLKFGDYQRYRNYCSKRLKRLRISMKFAYGRGKFQHKKVEEEKCYEPKMLLVLLFNVERLWAYAMDLKQMLSNQQKTKDNRRIKFHIQRKFKKALKWAKTLQNVCHEQTEKKTALEAEAYSEYMEACYNFEVEKWKQSEKSFIKSRQIYTELIKISDSLAGLIFQEKIEQIDQSLRYCSHKLGKELQNFTIDQILKANAEIQDPVLKEKFEALIEENRKKQIENQSGIGTSIEYQGEQLPIRNEKVLIILQKLQEGKIILQKLSEEKSMIDQQDSDNNLPNFEARIQQYVEMFALYDEAIKLNTQERDEKKDQENLQKIYQKIINYFYSNKLERLLDRNALQLNNAREKFNKENGIKNLTNFSLKKNQKLKLTTPHEIVKWSDNLLNTYKQFIDFEKSNPNASFLKQLALEEHFIQTVRCFYVCLLYLSFKRFNEAFSLLGYCQTQLQNCESSLLPEYKIGFDMKKDIQQLSQLVASLQSKCQVGFYENKAQEFLNEGEIQTQISDMKLETKVENSKSLQDLVEENLTNPSNKINLKQFELENLHLVDFPPKLEMVNCKPIFYDLGYSYLKYESIEHKIKQEKKGIIKGVFSKFNFFKKQ